MKSRIVLFGVGQVACALYANFSHDSKYEVVGFTVDREYLTEERLFNLPVVPFESVEAVFPPSDYGMHVAVSYRRVNQLRAEKYAQAREKGYWLASYVSSRAATLPGLEVGDNCVIGANASIGPFSRIGSDTVVAGGCVVAHHCTIGDHCFLAAGVIVSGSVSIAPYSFVGAGAVIRDRLTIARSTVIGAGAVILEDTVEQGVYLGRTAERLAITSDRLPIA